MQFAGHASVTDGAASDGFRQFNPDMPVGFTAARAHLQPMPNLGLQFPQCFLAGRGRHSNRTQIRADMFGAPVAFALAELTDKSHRFGG